ncbi:hypothetical protein [Aliiruegeria lutimaris]|uniref:Uncharacterized protein n=1 Tax=Aliiruegeria lutimaris TaxID=571298 RepID=A0A1G8TYW3_9RHOB|nr:hypothetical protein [Aliiruegeria lutimaris]SDJ46637.1 hypothetical protein SAMN04488026_10182 [Aliiruegeria lutimaris]
MKFCLIAVAAVGISFPAIAFAPVPTGFMPDGLGLKAPVASQVELAQNQPKPQPGQGPRKQQSSNCKPGTEGCPAQGGPKSNGPIKNGPNNGGPQKNGPNNDGPQQGKQGKPGPKKCPPNQPNCKPGGDQPASN